MTRRASLRSLLDRPVVLKDIELGRPCDALLDVETMRIVGFEVRCRDETQRFLPLGAARVLDDRLEIPSALILLEDDDVAFYRKRGRMWEELRRSHVEREGTPLGELVDFVISENGAVEAVDVAGEAGRSRVPLDDSVSIGGVRRQSAA